MLMLFTVIISLNAVNAEEQQDNLQSVDSSNNMVLVQGQSEDQNTGENPVLTASENSSLQNVSENSGNVSVMVAGPEASDYFTIDQIKGAASNVRSHVEIYNKLPDTVTINGTNVTMAQFLELLTTALLKINAGNNSTSPLFNFTNASNPKENIAAGNMYKAEYLKLASDIKNYMDSSGKAPDYAYGTSLGPYLRFENLVYMYAMILDYYNTSGNMAGWAAMVPWSTITSRPFVDPSAPKFTIDQIKSAATTIRNNVENNHTLPDKVTINGTDITMPQFLELLTTALLQINSGNTNLIPLRNATAPANPKENIAAGNMYKAEYLKLASDIKNYMDSSGKAPDYAYGTSLGPYLRFENLVYMYAMILDYYNTSGNMAGWAAMKPWKLVIAEKFTIDQIKTAASTVKSQVETDHKLPDTVNIGGKSITMAQFLELMTTALLQINNGNTNPIPCSMFNNATNPNEYISAGNINKSEYLKIASDIKNYMDSSGRAPDYALGTSIGPQLRFENLVYMYAMILDYYKISGNMPGWASMKPWAVVSRLPITSLSQNEILNASASVRDYIETNHRLPDSVTISSIEVSMPQFLELLTKVLLLINGGNTSNINLYNFTYPSSQRDNIHKGYVYKSEYMKLASDINNFMNSNGRSPDFAYMTSLGTYFGFDNLVYMYSMILGYYNDTHKIADYAVMNPLSMRAYWMWSTSANSFDPWALQSAGITDIFVVTKSVSGGLYYNELQHVIDVCRPTGIRVHAWIICFSDSSVGSWVNPGDTGYQNYLRGIINNIARNYAVNGIHLDYVRYSGVESNGHAAWQQPGGTSSAVGVITEFVQSVYSLVKSINPKIAVSAAVMPEGDENARRYGQDYSRLADYLDFFTPMSYEGNFNKNPNDAWITSVTRYIVDRAKGKPVYAGLTTYWSDWDHRSLSPSELDADVSSAKAGGAAGYVLFRYNDGTSYIPPWT